MATSTAQNIIEKALQKLVVLADGESATATQLADGLDSLNLMLDSWAGRSLLTTAQIRESFTLTANKSSYTIGSGGDFDTTKPFEIVSGFIRDSDNYDYTPISVVSRGIFDSYSDKAMTTVIGIPKSLFYDPGATQQATQVGTIHLYPIPDSADTYTIFIESEKPFTEFSALSSTVTFPPSYKRAMIYNLAIELASDYGKTASAEVVKIADDSMRIIENVNSRNKKAVSPMNLPGSEGAYNVNTD